MRPPRRKRRDLPLRLAAVPATILHIGQDLPPPHRERLAQLTAQARDIEARNPARHRRHDRIPVRDQVARQPVPVVRPDQARVAVKRNGIHAPPPTLRVPRHVGDHGMGVELRIEVAAGHVAERRRRHERRLHPRTLPRLRVPAARLQKRLLHPVQRRPDRPRHAPAPPNGRPGDGAPSAATPPAIRTSAPKRSGRIPDGARTRRAGPAPAGSPSPAHDPAAASRTPATTPARPASDPAPPPHTRATRSPRGALPASREALPRRRPTRCNTPPRTGNTSRWPTTRSDCGPSLPSKRTITGRAEPCRANLSITREDWGPGSAGAFGDTGQRRREGIAFGPGRRRCRSRAWTFCAAARRRARAPPVSQTAPSTTATRCATFSKLTDSRARAFAARSGHDAVLWSGISKAALHMPIAHMILFSGTSMGSRT